MRNGVIFIPVISVKRQNILKDERLLTEDVVSVDTMNLQPLILYSTKLNSGLIKLLKWLMIFRQKKRASSIWLAECHGVKQMTAWLFRRKVQQAIKSSEEFLLEKAVYVDESDIGTPQKGEQGRSKSEKKVRLVTALEYRRGKTERGYAKIIDDYSSKSLEKIFHTHISKDAKITTDIWSGYKFLMKEYPHFEQKLSNKEQNFKMLHIQIRNFQN